MASYAFADPEFWDKISSETEKWRAAMAATNGMKYGGVHLGEDDDPGAPVASVLELEPGGLLPRHAHTCWRFEIVVKGSWIDKHGNEVLPGDVRVSRPGEFYGPYTAGPEGSLSLEVFSAGDRDLIWPDEQDEASAEIRASATRTANDWGHQSGVSTMETIPES
jgi:anti-sigma factor ChrR (cupin superfamily)